MIQLRKILKLNNFVEPLKESSRLENPILTNEISNSPIEPINESINVSSNELTNESINESASMKKVQVTIESIKDIAQRTLNSAETISRAAINSFQTIIRKDQNLTNKFNVPSESNTDSPMIQEINKIPIQKIIEEEQILIRTPEIIDELIEIDVDHNLIEEQTQDIDEINKELIILQEIVVDLNKMLGIQGEKLIEIEEKLEVSDVNIQQGNIALQVAEKIEIKTKTVVGKIIAISVATVGVVGTGIILAFIL
ncbi:Hypothetical protein HVR_LOCUS1069 [uncultured virus]|nr:Hypothetical protein HVR_LOCUS1069 [uncultured virus]